MSDAMEEIDTQEAAASVKPQSNGETDQDFFLGAVMLQLRLPLFVFLQVLNKQLTKEKTGLSVGGYLLVSQLVFTECLVDK